MGEMIMVPVDGGFALEMDIPLRGTAIKDFAGAWILSVYAYEGKTAWYSKGLGEHTPVKIVEKKLINMMKEVQTGYRFMGEQRRLGVK